MKMPAILLGMLFLLGACARMGQSNDNEIYFRINDKTTQSAMKKTAEMLQQKHGIVVNYENSVFDSDGMIQFLDMTVTAPNGAGGKAQGDLAGMETHDFGFKIDVDDDGKVTLTNLAFIDQQ